MRAKDTLRTRVVCTVLLWLVALPLAAVAAGGMASSAPAEPATTTSPLPLGPPASQPAPAVPPQTGDGSDGPQSTLLESLVGDDGHCPVAGAPTAGGTEPCFPTSHYDIGYDPGSGYTPASGYHTFLGALTALAFSWVQWLVIGAVSILRLVYTFTIASTLAAPVGQLAQQLQHMVEQVGWPAFALVLTVLFAAVQILVKGRVARGLTEIAVSVLVGAVFPAWILSHPDGFINATMRRTSEVSGALVELTSGCYPNCPAPPRRVDCPAPAGEVCGALVFDAEGMLIRPLARQVHATFVEEPYAWIDWGDSIAPGHPCYERLKAVLQNGPWGTSDTPRWIMKAGHSNGAWPNVDNIPGDNTACGRLERFNRTPTVDRLAAAVMLLLPAGLFVVMTLLIAFTLIGAELGIVALAVVAPFAWASGQLPERLRGLHWGWWRWVLRCAVLVVVMSGFLAFWMFVIRHLMSAAQGVPLMSRMSVVGDLVIVGFVLRHQILKSTKRTVAALRPHLGGGVQAGGGGRFLEGMAAEEVIRQTRHNVSRIRHAHQRVDAARNRYRYGANPPATGGHGGTDPGVTNRYRYGDVVRSAVEGEGHAGVRVAKAAAAVTAGAVLGPGATESAIRWSRDPRTQAVVRRLRPNRQGERSN